MRIILILSEEIHYKESPHLPAFHSLDGTTSAHQFLCAFSHNNYLMFPQKYEQINAT